VSAEDYGVPQPPEIKKPWVFKTAQKLGMPILFLIPILAIFGVFGNSSTMVTERGQNLALETSFPTKLRHKTIAPLVVKVTNLAAQTVPTVTLKFDEEYLSAFSNVAFQPGVDEITDDAYYVHVRDLEANETRLVTLEVQAEQYWRHEGIVGAAVGGSNAASDVEVELQTFLFP